MHSFYEKYLGFVNVGSKLKTMLRIISGIYMVLGGVVLAFAISTIFISGTDFIGESIVVVLLTLIGLPIVLILLHIPLWFTYDFADIYDLKLQSQNQQIITQLEILNRQNQKMVAQNEMQNKHITVQTQMLKKIADVVTEENGWKEIK